MPSKCYQQRNLLPFKNWHYPTIAISSSLLLLPNQIQIHLPNSERSSSTDPALWWRKLQCLLQDTKQGERAANAQKIWTPHWLSGKDFFFFLVLLHMACGNSLTREKTAHPAVQSLLTTEPPGKPRQRFVKATLRLRVIGCLLSWWTFFCLLGGKVIRWCLGNLNHQHLWF